MPKFRRLFAPVQADIFATRKVLNRARNAEFRTSADILNNISSSAMTTLTGTARQLTAEQQRQLAALQRLRSNAGRAQRRIVGRAESQVANLYGAAGAGYAAPAVDVLQARARGSQTALRGVQRAGGVLGRANAAAMGTVGAGLQEAKSAAEYALAEAKLYRARNDAALIAQQQLSLDQVRLQAQLDFQMWKKQQDYMLKLEEKNTDLSGMTAVASAGANAFTGLRAIYNTFYDAQGNKYTLSELEQKEDGLYVRGTDTKVNLPNASQAAAQYITDNGIFDENQRLVIGAVASAMYQAGIGKGPGLYGDTNTEQLVLNAVQQQMALLYPNYSKHSDDIAKLITQQVMATNSAAAASASGRGDQGRGPIPESDGGISASAAAVGGGLLGAGAGAVIGGPLGAGVGGVLGTAGGFLYGALDQYGGGSLREDVINGLRARGLSDAQIAKKLKELGL